MAENEKKSPASGGDTSVGTTPPPAKKKKKKNKILGSKWFKWVIIALIVIAAIVGYRIYANIQAQKTAQEEATSNTSVVTRGDVTYVITGSGTVEPYDTYEIVPTVTGTIDYSYFEEGDTVEEGDVLYKFNSDVADNAIKTAQNAIKTQQNSVTSALNNISQAETTLQNRAEDVEKAEENISELTIYANSTGKVSGLSLTVGNNASGTICTITDTKTLLAKIPFNASQFAKISVGDSVTVSIEKYMTYTTGKVIRKYSAAGTGSDGSVVYDVEIQLDDGVDLSEGTAVTATVHTSSGDVNSSLSGTIYFPDSTTVIAEQSGKVQTVYVKNGDWVQKGEVIAQLESSDLQDALKTARQNYTNAQTSLQEARNSYQNSLTNLENAQSNLEDAQSNADDYTITAPISGIILSKDYKAGDTIYGTNSTTLMTIADMSKMKFTISVDELDIANIALGQEVEITSDALEGVELTGYITNISQLGSSSNGVTNYPVEVTIDEPGDLMSGMNVSADIVISEAHNVIRVSTTAISYYNGAYYATVVGYVEGLLEDSDSASSDSSAQNERGEMPEPAEGEMPEGSEAPAQADASEGEESTMTASQQKRAVNAMTITLADEEERVEVVLGVSDDDYYEIISGLEVGQVVRDEGSSSSSSSGLFGMMGRMSGNMGGGGGGPR